MYEFHQMVNDGLLSVRSTPYGEEVVVVSLAGELDRSKVASAARAIGVALAKEDVMAVVDLPELDFLDSSGVALLSDLNRHKRSRGRLRLVPSTSLGVSRILAVTRVGATLDTVENGVSEIALEKVVGAATQASERARRPHDGRADRQAPSARPEPLARQHHAIDVARQVEGKRVSISLGGRY